MQAAVDLVAAGPTAFATGARLGAVSASDRGVTAVVERMVGDVVKGEVFPHVVLAPVRQGVDLPEAVLSVPRELLGTGAAVEVAAAHAAHPGVQRGQGLAQRLDLAQLAALVR